MSFEVDLLHLQYLLQTGDLTSALIRIEEMTKDVERRGVDVYHSTELAVFKARVFAEAGWAERGFSVAIRAASLAQRVGLMPAVWDAVGCVCVILNGVGEFSAVVALLDAIIPQVKDSLIKSS